MFKLSLNSTFVIVPLISLALFGCGGETFEVSSRPTISVKGNLASPNSQRDMKQGDEMHRTKWINGSGGYFLISIGEEIQINGTGNRLEIGDGCLVKRANSDLFDVLSCAEAPAAGCLKGQVSGNSVVYLRSCERQDRR